MRYQIKCRLNLKLSSWFSSLHDWKSKGNRFTKLNRKGRTWGGPNLVLRDRLLLVLRVGEDPENEVEEFREFSPKLLKLQYFITQNERSEAFFIGFYFSFLSYSSAFFIGRCRTHGTDRRNWCQGRNGTFL